MVEINIYQPERINLKVDFPETWNELSRAEIIFIARKLLTESDVAAVRSYILKFIIESRVKEKLPEDWFLKLDPEQVVMEIFPLLDFIFTQNDLTNTPDPIRIGKITYYPQPFKNITCAEYEDCEAIAYQFSENPSGKLLANLAAILFRPADRSGGTAEPGQQETEAPEPYMTFNPRTNSYYTYKAELKIKQFITLPPEELYANFIWYSGNRAELPGMFPDVYDGSSSGEKDMEAFTKCIHSGAGPKNGTRQQIRTMGLYEFMYDMDQEARKAKELEAEYAKMSKT